MKVRFGGSYEVSVTQHFICPECHKHSGVLTITGRKSERGYEAEFGQIKQYYCPFCNKSFVPNDNIFDVYKETAEKICSYIQEYNYPYEIVKFYGMYPYFEKNGIGIGDFKIKIKCSSISSFHNLDNFIKNNEFYGIYANLDGSLELVISVCSWNDKCLDKLYYIGRDKLVHKMTDMPEKQEFNTDIHRSSILIDYQKITRPSGNIPSYYTDNVYANGKLFMRRKKVKKFIAYDEPSG